MTSFDTAMMHFDRDYLWHPYGASRSPEAVYPVVSADGCLIKLADGRELVDGMASWWSAIHGYNHPMLNAALNSQLDDMAHIMFGGLTHQPAVELGRRLHRLLPAPLERIFYCDSGSVSVEVAVKMAVQYQHARKQPQRTRLIALRYAYHGDTFVAMSLCDPVNGMHGMFKGVLPEQIFARAPACIATCDDDAVADLKRCFDAHRDEIAAVILEPVVQGAGGMRIYGAQYLDEVRKLCDEHGVLLILDEIATGFGRTGEMFAFQHAARCVPDIICLGKALTGGYMSLAATIASAEVADTVDSGDPGMLMHGPTYMANPLACAVAAASLDLLEDSDWQQKVQKIEYQLTAELSELKAVSGVADVRVKGALGVVETSYPIPQSFCDAFVRQGVWIRPFRNLVYIMPPYTINASQLTHLSDAMKSVIRSHKQ